MGFEYHDSIASPSASRPITSTKSLQCSAICGGSTSFKIYLYSYAVVMNQLQHDPYGHDLTSIVYALLCPNTRLCLAIKIYDNLIQSSCLVLFGRFSGATQTHRNLHTLIMLSTINKIYSLLYHLKILPKFQIYMGRFLFTTFTIHMVIWQHFQVVYILN